MSGELTRQEIEAAAAQLELEPRAHARRTDPETSHEAAASVTEIRASQIAVLSCLREHGPMPDHELERVYLEIGSSRGWPYQTGSSLRSRRDELTDPAKIATPLIVDTGRRVRKASGRRAIVWAAT